MKYQLITILIFIGANLTAQDTIKHKIAELWWEDSIEIINNRNETVAHDDALSIIRNQQVSTNCWSDFYRYTQNMQQSSGQRVTYFPLVDSQIIQENDNTFKVVSTKNIDTGENEINNLFSYKLVSRTVSRKEENYKMSDWFNKELKISKVLFGDSLHQFVDECLEKYSIRFLQNGTFVQGYNNEVNCRCEISGEDFKSIYHAGFAQFNTANHSLLGLEGDWKILDGKLYLKFDSGNIFKYDCEISNSNFRIMNAMTIIELASHE